MGKYSTLASHIVEHVGGKENVAGLVHCITRLRFTLKDESKAHDEILQSMDGVVSVVKSAGQYQVVIGNHVGEVYEDVCDVLQLTEDDKHTPQMVSKRWLDRAVDVISGIFQPILGIMAACGMLKGFNVLFALLGVYSATSGVSLVINAAGDALFNFLPLFLGYTAAKKFGLKPMLGLAIGAALCYPAIQADALAAGKEPLYTLFEGTLFSSPVYVEFVGIPIIAVGYTGTVIPVILAVWFGAQCEKLFNRIVPDLLKFFFVPMLTLLVTLPVTILLLGPVATFGSLLISHLTLAIRSFSPLLAGALVGFTWQILVIFGMHWGFIPVYINNVLTLGYDNVMMPFYACTFATSSVVLAMYFKTKDAKLKKMALPNFISGIFGVTESAIYGMLLPYKKPFIISCIAGGIGGAFYGYFNFRKFIMGGMGIFELPNMMNPDGSYGNILVALAGIALTMVVAFALTMVFWRDPVSAQEQGEDDSQVDTAVAQSPQVIASPAEGKVVQLSDVQDEAFASGKLGQGVALLPDGNTICAPADATVMSVFSTGHALGLLTNEGAEILIHVGMDTVQLEGKYFHPCVEAGQKVKQGDILLTFDREEIEAAGYSLITPIIITNSESFASIKPTDASSVRPGDPCLSLS